MITERSLTKITCTLLTVLLTVAPLSRLAAEPMPDNLSDRIVSVEDASDRQLRALANNQLDVVEMLLTRHFLNNRENPSFPTDFSVLTSSVAWTVEVYDFESGEPVTASSATRDPAADTTIRPDFAQPGGGRGENGRTQQGGSDLPVSIDEIPINPGGLFYRSNGSTAYQVAVKWGEKPTQQVNRYRSRPYNFYASRDSTLDRPISPEDRSLFMVAQFLQDLLPELDRRYAYFFDAQQIVTEDEFAQFSTRKQRAAELGFIPYNPFNNEVLTTSDSYRAGHVYTGPLVSDYSEEIFYCFSNGRIRSFTELVRPQIRRQRRAQIQRRDRAVRGSSQPTRQNSGDQSDSESPEDSSGGDSDEKPWRN